MSPLSTMATGRAHLVVGGDGLIGSGVVEWLTARGERVYATTRRPEKVGPMHPFLDLKQNVNDWELPEPVETVFICAGATRMQDCEERPDETALVNVVNPGTIAAKLVARGAFIVGLSSNAVFDGTVGYRKVGDPHSPLTQYGRQQGASEKGLLAIGSNVAVVRFAKVLSPTLPVFGGWLQALAAGEPIRPLIDLTMAPLPRPFIVELIGRVGMARRTGMFQASGAADIPYSEAGRILVEQVGLPATLCRPATAEELGIQLLPSLRHTTLDMTESRNAFSIEPPTIEEAMRFLASNFQPAMKGRETLAQRII